MEISIHPIFTLILICLLIFIIGFWKGSEYRRWHTFYNMDFNGNNYPPILQWFAYPWIKPKINRYKNPLMKEYEEKLLKKTKYK